MKRFIAFFFAMVILMPKGYIQEIYNAIKTSPNYFTALTTIDGILSSKDSVPAPEGKRYLRWESFWRNHITSDGNYKTALALERQELNSNNLLTSNSEITFKNIGPINTDTIYGNIGRIASVNGWLF